MPLLFWLVWRGRIIDTRPDHLCFLNFWIDRLGGFDGFGWLRSLRLPDRRILPESLGLPFGKLALCLLNIEDVGNVAAPNLGQLVNGAWSCPAPASGGRNERCFAEAGFCPP